MWRSPGSGGTCIRKVDRARPGRRCVRVLAAGCRGAGSSAWEHALVQNVRPGYYELAAEEPASRRLAVVFEELATAT
jgi:hypothetical protein